MFDNMALLEEQKTVPIIPAPLDDGPNDAASKESALLGSGRLGCVVIPSTRRQLTYVITATELMNLETWKASENTAHKICSGALSFAAALVVPAIFSDFGRLSALAQAVTYVCMPVCVLLAIVTFLFGRHASAQSHEMLRILKEETEHTELVGGRR